MFVDLDAIEQSMGKPVCNMTAIELVTYVKMWIKAVYEVDLPVSANRERYIFSGLKRTYGNDAGRIVKWPFWKYDGKRSGEFVTYSTFSKGMKWITDIWYMEMQEQIKREMAQKTPSGNPLRGFGTLQDL
jgi:hypothetical protein